MKVLVLGSNGMIGGTIFSFLSKNDNLDVIGSIKNLAKNNNFSSQLENKFVMMDALNYKNVEDEIKKNMPDIVINCIGVTKHVIQNHSKSSVKLINSDFPFHLKVLSANYNFRVIHVSTDCVFLGNQGNYIEEDKPDAIDLYGQTKARGEIVNCKNILTIRTSTIGHEFKTKYGLLEWFLQQEECLGYSNAFFSGLTTIELAKVIQDLIIPNTDLYGIYHISGRVISKFDLLKIIDDVYKTNIILKKNSEFVIDRSLNSNKFKNKTSYSPPKWRDQILEMKDYHIR